MQLGLRLPFSQGRSRENAGIGLLLAAILLNLVELAARKRWLGRLRRWA